MGQFSYKDENSRKSPRRERNETAPSTNQKNFNSIILINLIEFSWKILHEIMA